MKKLYYSVEKETEVGNEEEYITGNKTVCVYEIVNNEPKNILTFECGNEENTQLKIIDELEEKNHMFDKDATRFILL